MVAPPPPPVFGLGSVEDPVALVVLEVVDPEEVVVVVDPEISVVDPEVVEEDNVVVVVELEGLVEDGLDEDLFDCGSSSCGGNGTV